MKMNMKTTKTMRGFMCQSPASTVVCMNSDPRSVIVPRRSERTSVEHARLMNSRYYQLMESRRHSMGDNRSVTLASIKRDRDQERKPPKTSIVPPSLTSSENVFQVVVMKVSLHCQGCAGKVKKHLSKMEGVTSFSIDLETKRVTVMGHVSPVRVLESISKVKKAEFWTC